MNLANALTILRILLIPAFAFAYYRVTPIIALALFLLAGLTDYLDGYLARKLKMITDVGKLLDPLADKLMLLTALYCLADTNFIPWWVFIALAAKEGLMVIGSLFLLEKKVVVYSNIFGKVSTVLFIVAIVFVFPWHTIVTLTRAGNIILYIATASSFLAMGIYAYNALTKRYESKNEGEEDR